MKKLITFLNISLIFFALSSCVVYTPGPPGNPGRAFFGVDFEHNPPFSYWDDNRSIPSNPELGQYFLSGSGLFNFEYFVNPHEYWYGTYDIRIMGGGPGGPHGEPGYNGADTYLMLICDPYGYHTHGVNYKKGEDGEVVLEGSTENGNFTIKMKKTSVNDRAPNGSHSPY